MMRPSSSNRKSRRHSSGSNSLSSSSIVTVKAPESRREHSATRLTSNQVSSGNLLNSSGTQPTTSRLQNVSPVKSKTNGPLTLDGGSSESGANINRWSQSTNSSIHTAQTHTRHSSFTKRFSLGMSALNGIHSTVTRSPSPGKRRRQTEATTQSSELLDTNPVSEIPVLPLDRNLPLPTPEPLPLSDHEENLNADTDRRYLPTANISGSLARTIQPATPPDDISSARAKLRKTSETNSQNSLSHPLHSKSLHPSALRGTDASSQSILQSNHDEVPSSFSYRGSSDARKSMPRTSSASTSVVTERAPEGRSGSSNTRTRREKDKKTMLSKALQRANEAVQFDNQQDYVNAGRAYNEACDLLSQVMQRSSSEEDKQKLRKIRSTYTTRIEELQQMDGRLLPQQPAGLHDDSDDNQEIRPSLDVMSDDDEPIIETAQLTRIVDTEHGTTNAQVPSSIARNPTGVSDGSVLAQVPGPNDPAHQLESKIHQPKPKPKLAPQGLNLPSSTLAPPFDPSIVPHPLSPRRSPAPEGLEFDYNSESIDLADPSEYFGRTSDEQNDLTKVDSQSSWLRTVVETKSNTSSSHHSISSLNEVHRKHIRVPSGGFGAEFDAAFDAAVEAAYDEGYEPYEEEDTFTGNDARANPSSLGRPDRSDYTTEERERMIAAAKAHEAYRKQQHRPINSHEFLPFELQTHAEEEERILDSLIQESSTERQSTSTQSNATVPRQSNSSGFSGRTWGSSIASSLATAGTSLSTVDEGGIPHGLNLDQSATEIPAPKPPPTTSLPQIPSKSPKNVEEYAPKGSISQVSAFAVPQAGTTVRDRRLSGQKARQLKIETAATRPTGNKLDQFDLATKLLPTRPSPEPPIELRAEQSQGSSGNLDVLPRPQMARLMDPRLISSPYPSPLPAFIRTLSQESNSATSSETPGMVSTISQDGRPSPLSDTFPGRAPSERPALRKNASSLSLKNKNLIPPNTDEYDMSPGTPMSIAFSAAAMSRRPGGGVAVGTPTASSFAGPLSGMSGNMNLFENNIHSATHPGFPNSEVTDAPRPLEPCPDSFLLRPFWLLRCLHQTLAHPRGGYLTTKLFVSREVWEIKNVKLKCVDEKISNCDLLSAALSKLSAVDTLDADAVLTEMQSLDGVLDQAQANLSKKLGNEVGVQNISSLFKDAPTGSPVASNDSNVQAPGSDSTADRASGSKTGSKSYLASWRKLRSKNSSTNLTSGFMSSKEAPKDKLLMTTLPMTSATVLSSRFHRRELPPVKSEGPNANYMSALARLCDAAQVLDQITRQVEDPGLKLSSQTHVGLELCARHASEFFGFYVCRFILQDVMLLAEKHVKRATEWTLSS